jgi:6-pyruvoyltetrahydropterin/6-carboxytetrahydropterin synthase
MPEFRIGKRFTFEAGHCLPTLPEGHKCRRLHGHSYTVEVVLASGQLVGPGFVADFGDLAPLRGYIDGTLDHRYLNDVLDAEPTCEVIAAHLAAWYLEHLAAAVPGRLHAVRVWETATCWAEYVLDAA